MLVPVTVKSAIGLIRHPFVSTVRISYWDKSNRSKTKALKSIYSVSNHFSNRYGNIISGSNQLSSSANYFQWHT